MSGRDSGSGDGSTAPLPPGDEDFQEKHFGPEDIEASLNDALSDLERMLDRRGEGEGEPRAGDRNEHGQEEPYPIPLLEDVVIPGPGITAFASPPATPPQTAAAQHVDLDESAARRRLAIRLASEIEVIVQDRLEAAVRRACEEIREQVRNHMDIILPEIVEEMVQHRHRDED